MTTAFSKSSQSAKTYEKGFSLVEVLVVMTIVAVLFGLGWNAFYSLRRTMRLRQATENLKAELKYAQRSAMFIRRDSGERWINGVGIDFEGMKDTDADLTYTVFKWCSSSDNYVDFEDEVSNFPIEYGDCISGSNQALTPLQGKEDVYVSSENLNFALGFKGSADLGESLRFIVFEAVTGYPHFFDEDGNSFDAGVNDLAPDDYFQLMFYHSGFSNGISLNKQMDLLLVPNMGLQGVDFNLSRCIRDCDGKECGNDGCGGSCGPCGDDEICNEENICEYHCVPDCEYCECGDDGCGGTYGPCDDNETCENGVCEPEIPVCFPECGDLAECGVDGCGRPCGRGCEVDEICLRNRRCWDIEIVEPKPKPKPEPEPIVIDDPEPLPEPETDPPSFRYILPVRPLLIRPERM
jgi:prepilin-type N-terminal cleavage/methylation domain-containing protein